jgi:hypothetical protein
MHKAVLQANKGKCMDVYIRRLVAFLACLLVVKVWAVGVVIAVAVVTGSRMAVCISWKKRHLAMPHPKWLYLLQSYHC